MAFDTLPPSVHATHIADSYPILEVNHPAVRARVALHGAHLMEWTPTGQQPVIYLSPQAEYREGKAIRGGIPICWPWFGPNESTPDLPSHGFARNRMWELEAASESEKGVALTFALQDTPATHALWPHPFRLELHMKLEAELHLALHMQNTGSSPFTITAALHSYLAVGDIRRTVVHGLDGAEYMDTSGPRKPGLQQGDLHFTGEVDRDYMSGSTVRVSDAGLGRVITVQGSGSGSTVVWNPWIEKAKALKDLPDKDYLRFVCVETANVWRDFVTLTPGGTHELSATLRVE